MTQSELAPGTEVVVTDAHGCMDEIGRQGTVVSRTPPVAWRGAWYLVAFPTPTDGTVEKFMRRCDLLTHDEVLSARAEDEESNRFCFPDSE